MSLEDTEHLQNACILNSKEKAFLKQTYDSSPKEHRADISILQKADYGLISPKHQLNSKSSTPQQQQVISIWHKPIKFTYGSTSR